MTIQLGFLLHSTKALFDTSVRADLEPVLDDASSAEELGFDHVWIGDSARTERGWPRAECMTMLAALAMRTTRLKLGVVPLTLPLRNPVLLAHELATIDVLSRGRLLVSPSSGKLGPQGEREFACCGIAYNERGARLTEMLQIMRRLWTEESVTFHGRFYELDDAEIFPKPIRRPIPLLVATSRDERALRRTGRYGDGWITTTPNAADFQAQLRVIEQSAREAGRSFEGAPKGLYATFHLDADGERARADGPGHVAAYFRSPGGGGENSPFFGSPRDIAQRLQGYVDAGLTMVIARLVDPDVAKQADLLRETAALLRR